MACLSKKIVRDNASEWSFKFKTYIQVFSYHDCFRWRFLFSSARLCRLIVFADYHKAEENSELRQYKRNVTDESKEQNVTSNILNSVSIKTFGSIVCGTQICHEN